VSIAAALQAAREAIPVAEARLLLCHQLGCTAAWLEAHRDDPLDDQQQAVFESMVARRAAGEPVAYLCGTREFYGRDFMVSPAVLIPRPETELLVELALQKSQAIAQPQILDLGTGSGCIAITLALEHLQAQVTAADVSTAALALAAANGARLGARVTWRESDWFAALEAERFDIIVANPPYVSANDPHLAQGDLRHEPQTALQSGADGLDAIRQIAADAPAHLRPGAWLMIEHGYDQAAAVAALLVSAGLASIEQHRDLAGIVRVSGGRKGLTEAAAAR
jgi:release factor glutamine methyltransferase